MTVHIVDYNPAIHDRMLQALDAACVDVVPTTFEVKMHNEPEWGEDPCTDFTTIPTAKQHGPVRRVGKGKTKRW